MPFGVDSSGFTRKPLLVSRDEILSYWKAHVSPTIDTSDTGLEAQFAGGFAEQIGSVWDALGDVYASRDPAQASGQALDDLLHLRGVYRKAPRESLVTVTVNVNAGTYVAGSLVAYVTGSPASRFANDATLVAASTGNYSVTFRAEQTGPVAANAGTLTVVVPTAGFNSVTNPSDAVLGDDGETDTAYYARSELEAVTSGSATVDAVVAAVRALSGVTFVRGYVNDEPTVDANGVVGNAFEIVVLGGADQAIADAIRATKAAGIRAVGSTTVNSTDAQGNVYPIGFTRPTRIQPYIDVVCYVDKSLFPGDAAAKSYLIDWADATLSVGNDVVIAKVTQIMMELAGMYDVTVYTGSAFPPVSTASFVIRVREYADFDTSRVRVTHIALPGPA